MLLYSQSGGPSKAHVLKGRSPTLHCSGVMESLRVEPSEGLQILGVTSLKSTP